MTRHDETVDVLEQTLDCYDPAERAAALKALLRKAAEGEIALPTPGAFVNLHAHTFYSYNAYGYSPAGFAWRARKAGLAAGGIVDFDVLDGVDEFLASARQVGLPACAGIETRVFVPPFATRVINSPGEPGIAYHMGVGFVSSNVTAEQSDFLARLQRIASDRNRSIVARVNPALAPVELDYDRDVRRLTPRGNATERHLCLAYARKARERFADLEELAAFWSEKLGTDARSLDLPEGPRLQGEIRAKLMKRGGVGYVAPDQGAFPTMEELNRFALSAGAIPTLAWLDGMSDGEKCMEELLDYAAQSGLAAVNIIPDRNYTPGKIDAKLQNLRSFIALARERQLPIFVGTEMNSPGNKFVDAFDTAELAPYVPEFLRGARIAFAHTALQAAAGMGYSSEWARARLPDPKDRNAFFEEVGKRLDPRRGAPAGALSPAMDPEAALKACATDAAAASNATR